MFLLCAVLGGYGGYRIWRRLQWQPGPAAPTLAVEQQYPISRLSPTLPPALLIYGMADTTVVPDENEQAVKQRMGAKCELVALPGVGHNDAPILEAAPVLRYLRAHVPASTPIVILHCMGRGATDWTRLPLPTDDPYQRQKTKLYGALKQAGYNLIVPEEGLEHWGNNKALAHLEDVIGSRQVAIIGESMGAMLMWRYVEKHPSQVQCEIGLSPVCSLTALCKTPLGKSVVRAYP